jgi:iron(III) transport system ATP-binding protein
MSSVRLDRVTKRFSGSGGVVDLDLEIRAGEFVTLLGPSGCGKTTTLRVVAGFEEPESGRVIFDETDVTSRPPERRDIGMVFQSYALFPHLDVFENVAFGLRARGLRGSPMVDRVRKALRLVGLEGTGLRAVQALSGGQQQRVALARAIVIEPRILLLDEPLSNLDARLREEMRAEIRSLQRTLRITTVYVTHDREEALAISDRIAVLRAGCLEQVGAPAEVFSRPGSAFVARFVGGANLLRGRVETSRDGRALVSLASGGSLECEARGSVKPGDAVWLAIRPSSIRVEHPRAARIAGRVSRIEYRGEGARVWIAVGDADVELEAIVPAGRAADVGEGSIVGISVSPGDVVAFLDSEGARA